jgi:hypothetical protein
MAMPRFAGWRKQTPATATLEKEVTEFLGQAWIMANLCRHSRELAAGAGLHNRTSLVAAGLAVAGIANGPVP